MLKAKKNLFKLLVLLFILILKLNGTALAQGECVGVPTITGNPIFAGDWFTFKWDPNNPDTVARDNSVTVNVINGAPSFNWEIVGNDFWFDSDYTITSMQTGSRSVTIYAGPNACGSAIISVTDASQDLVSGSLRVPSHGRWVLVHQELCGEIEFQPAVANCSSCSTVVVGGFKYMDCWWGGNRSYRYSGPYCSKWDDTEDLSNSCCRDPGYFPCFGLFGLYNHDKWQWKCN